jgi:citrate lyase subunit beta / citryl-CoA lyase
MTPRSLLFVPGDSERKQRKALVSGADALILDLEDSVTASERPAARRLVSALLASGRDPSAPALWVRVNSPASGELLEDLAAVVHAGPAGIVLPKVSGASDVLRVAQHLDALEPAAGLAPGAIRILPIVTETPQALLARDDYAIAGRRLAALTWGIEDLATAVGADPAGDEYGALGTPYGFLGELARSFCLLLAAAAGVPAIDTVWAAIADGAGLERETVRARRDGFAGKLAIHPDQIEPIHRAFAPAPDELEQARRIVAAFEAAGGAGTISLDGRMLDRPHLRRAQRVLEAAGPAAKSGR